DLPPGRVIRMRMVPVGAGRPGPDLEAVDELLAGRDRVERAAVRCEWQVQPVPVNRGRLRQLIAEPHDHVIALPHLQGRAGPTAGVGVYGGLGARPQGPTPPGSGE